MMQNNVDTAQNVPQNSAKLRTKSVKNNRKQGKIDA